MKKITHKILATSILVLFMSSFIPNVLFMIFGNGMRPDEINPKEILFAAIITVTLTIVAYSFLIDRILIKRIKHLNEATKQVMDGNFETELKDHQKDEIAELSKNFDKMIQELKSNEYLNKDFVRNFSHELKTPLSAIKGYAELLQAETLTEEEKQRYTQIIIEESARLSQLSKNMLLISQIDNQVIVPKNDTFNITELLRNVMQLQQLDWEQKQLQLNLDVEDVTITSSKELIYQVLQNLVSNAIKFSENESPINIKLKKEDKIQFEISNKGYLSEEDQRLIFDLFFVKDKSRSSKSNGVGLALSKRILEKLEGTLEVASKDDYITFKMEL